jgi:alanine racemase
VENRDNQITTLDENVLEFQTRIEMLLNDKENISNLKNVSVHQLLSLKAYIVEMDQKLKRAGNENEYALKKYKSYKEKYLHSVREIKQH